jgi:hypothetical protein
VAQNDTNPGPYPLDINSGFICWRWTEANLRLADDLIRIPPFWHVDEARVNVLMKERGTPHALLDARVFPNGNKLDDGAVALRANCNDGRGGKEGMLRKMGLWYL